MNEKAEHSNNNNNTHSTHTVAQLKKIIVDKKLAPRYP